MKAKKFSKKELEDLKTVEKILRRLRKKDVHIFCSNGETLFFVKVDYDLFMEIYREKSVNEIQHYFEHEEKADVFSMFNIMDDCGD